MNSSNGLTMDNLLWMKKMVQRPPLYYATDENCLEDQILVVPQGMLYPQYFVCHPNDFPKMEAELSEFRTLIPIKDYYEQPS